MDKSGTEGKPPSRLSALNRAGVVGLASAVVLAFAATAASMHGTPDKPKPSIQEMEAVQSGQIRMDIEKRLAEIEKRLERIEMKIDAAAGHPVWHEMSGKPEKEKKQ